MTPLTSGGAATWPPTAQTPPSGSTQTECRSSADSRPVPGASIEVNSLGCNHCLYQEFQQKNRLKLVDELSRRLARIFLKDESGKRPVFAHHPLLQDDPHFRDHILFYEYFHGDNGSGVGASHQTGWTGLVAKLLQQSGE